MPNTRIVLLPLLCALAVAVASAQESETKPRYPTDELEQKYGVRPNAGTPKTKATRLELLLEAERRGILTDDMKADLADLRSKRNKFFSEAQESRDRFELFNSCKPMALWVDLSGDEEIITGITEEVLRDVAESRLKVARLRLRSDGFSVAAWKSFAALNLTVDVVGSNFTVSVEYGKRVTDIYGESGHVGTWRSTFTHAHNKSDWFVMGVVSDQLDRFLNEYLRVNEEACESK